MFELPETTNQRQAAALERIANELGAIRRELSAMNRTLNKPVDCITATATHAPQDAPEPVTTSEPVLDESTPPRGASDAREGICAEGK